MAPAKGKETLPHTFSTILITLFQIKTKNKLTDARSYSGNDTHCDQGLLSRQQKKTIKKVPQVKHKYRPKHSKPIKTHSLNKEKDHTNNQMTIHQIELAHINGTKSKKTS